MMCDGQRDNEGRGKSSSSRYKMLDMHQGEGGVTGTLVRVGTCREVQGGAEEEIHNNKIE